MKCPQLKENIVIQQYKGSKKNEINKRTDSFRIRLKL